MIAGYEQIRPLTELERRLLTPTFWAWLLLGLADDLHAINAGSMDPATPEWSVRLLLRRSPLMGAEAAPFRHGR